MMMMMMMRFTPTALDSRVSVMHSADGEEAAVELEELVEVLEEEEEEKGVVRGLKRQQVTAEREQ